MNNYDDKIDGFEQSDYRILANAYENAKSELHLNSTHTPQIFGDNNGVERSNGTQILGDNNGVEQSNCTQIFGDNNGVERSSYNYAKPKFCNGVCLGNAEDDDKNTDAGGGEFGNARSSKLNASGHQFCNANPNYFDAPTDSKFNNAGEGEFENIHNNKLNNADRQQFGNTGGNQFEDANYSEFGNASGGEMKQNSEKNVEFYEKMQNFDEFSADFTKSEVFLQPLPQIKYKGLNSYEMGVLNDLILDLRQYFKDDFGLAEFLPEVKQVERPLFYFVNRSRLLAKLVALLCSIFDRARLNKDLHNLVATLIIIARSLVANKS